jgi:hypothetical protein
MQDPRYEFPRIRFLGSSVVRSGVHPQVRTSDTYHVASGGVEWGLSVGHNREVTVERDRQEAIARQEQMVEELRKAELVRDRLQGLNQIASLYPEGHSYRGLIEALQLDQVLEVVEEDIQTLQDALIHPRGT